jgi:signal recognition particle subunit SRP54
MPKELKNTEIDDGEIKRVEAIIQSMTPEERREPDVINGSRRLRIASGAGVTTGEVNALLKQFKQMQQMMKQMGVTGRAVKRGKKGKKGKQKKMRPSLPAGFPGPNVGLPGGPPLPGGIPGLGGSTRGPNG